MVSWVTVRLLAPTNCVDSKYIDSVQIFNESGVLAQSLPPCSFKVRLWGPLIQERSLAHEIAVRLKSFEKIDLFWPVPSQKKSIEVYHSSHEGFLFSADFIRLNHAHLRAGDLFEKLLLVALHPLSTDTTQLMTKEVAAEFYWMILNNKKDTLLSSAKQSETTKPWLSHYKSLSKYCDSDEHLMAHSDFCSLKRKIKEGLSGAINDSGAISWSIKPLLVQILRESFRVLPMNQQVAYLERLFFLSEWNDEDIFSPEATTIVQLEERFRQSVVDWLKPLLLPEAVVDKVLEMSSLSPARPYQFVRISEQLSDSVSLQKESHLVFSLNDKFYFSPSDVPVQLSRDDVLTQLPMSSVILMGCEWPSLEELLSYQNYQKNVYYILNCEGTFAYWKELAQLGVQQLLQAYPQIQFIEFNLRSLQLAQKRQGPLRSTSRLSDWQKWLGWREIAPAQAATQRPLSSIEGITRFRLSDPTATF